LAAERQKASDVTLGRPAAQTAGINFGSEAEPALRWDGEGKEGEVIANQILQKIVSWVLVFRMSAEKKKKKKKKKKNIASISGGNNVIETRLIGKRKKELKSIVQHLNVLV